MYCHRCAACSDADRAASLPLLLCRRCSACGANDAFTHTGPRGTPADHLVAVVGTSHRRGAVARARHVCGMGSQHAPRTYTRTRDSLGQGVVPIRGLHDSTGLSRSRTFVRQTRGERVDVQIGCVQSSPSHSITLCSDWIRETAKTAVTQTPRCTPYALDDLQA